MNYPQITIVVVALFHHPISANNMCDMAKLSSNAAAKARDPIEPSSTLPFVD